MSSGGILAEITDLVLNLDSEGLALRLPTLTDAERAAVADGLRGLLDVGDPFADRGEVLMMVGVAAVPGPAGAVSWLMRRDLNPRWSAAPRPRLLLKAMSGRPAAWRADLAVRLARRVRRPDDRVVPLALELLRAGEVTPPDHDPLVVAWLSAPGVPRDPLTPHLLPRIFDAAGAGRALAGETLTPKPSRWLVLAERELPRAQVAEGCVRRFLLGGDVQDLRFFARLHALVAPTPEESAGRLRDYLRLLPAAPGPVAELAWQQVRRARLDAADVAEAIEALTFRPEAGLAVKGLTWLDRELAASPERVADHVTALANAYAHASHEVRDRAVALTLKHAAHLTDPAPILEAAELLPPASARPLFEHFAGGLDRRLHSRTSASDPRSRALPRHGGGRRAAGGHRLDLRRGVAGSGRAGGARRPRLAAGEAGPEIRRAAAAGALRHTAMGLPARLVHRAGQGTGQPGRGSGAAGNAAGAVPGTDRGGAADRRGERLPRPVRGPRAGPLREHGRHRGHRLPAVPQPAHDRPAARVARLRPGTDLPEGRPLRPGGAARARDLEPPPPRGEVRPPARLPAGPPRRAAARGQGPDAAPGPAGHAHPRRRSPRPGGAARPPGGVRGPRTASARPGPGPPAAPARTPARPGRTRTSQRLGNAGPLVRAGRAAASGGGADLDPRPRLARRPLRRRRPRSTRRRQRELAL